MRLSTIASYLYNGLMFPNKSRVDVEMDRYAMGVMCENVSSIYMLAITMNQLTL